MRQATVEWKTHVCSAYCTEEVHAFEFMSRTQIANIAEEIAEQFGIPLPAIVHVREVPEALPLWASSTEWIERGPWEPSQAFLVYITIKRGEQFR